MTDTVTALTATYNLRLVILSITIAIIAAYTALDLTARVKATQGKARQLWLTSGAIAMGIGIWSMHFIAMLAYDLPILISYDFTIVILSMVVAIITSGCALAIVTYPQSSNQRFVLGGSVMGMGIVTMHYLGMFAIRLEAIAHHQNALVIAAILIAIGGSIVALWLAFQLPEANIIVVTIRQIVSAIFLGSAITFMHYTAINAVSFYPTNPSVTQLYPIMDNAFVAITIGISTFVILAIAMLAAIFDRRIAAEVAKAEVIRLNEARFRALEQNASDIIIVVSNHGTINYTSAAVKRLLGYAPEDWQTQNVASLFADQNQATQFFTQTLHNPDVDITAEFRLQHLNGDWRDFELIARNLSTQPEVAGVVITLRDITERKRNDLALRQSEERYRAFIAQSSEAIWRLELEQPIAVTTSEDEQIQQFYEYGYLAECNDVMAQMYGFCCAVEIIGIRLAQFLTPTEPENIQYLRNFIRSGYRLIDAESLEVDKQGNLKYFLNNLVGIVADGVLVRAWGTQRDISDRKQVQQALYHSEQRYRSLVEATAQIIWDTTEGEFVTPQPGWSAFTGQTNDELRGWGWLNAVHPEDRTLTAQTWRTALAQRTLYEFEHRLRRADGVYRYMSIRAVPVFEKDGSLREWIGVHTDITERKQVEAEREQLLKIEQAARAESEAANQMKDEFLATLSHELRTPLNAMLGWTTLLRTRKFDQTHIERALEIIERNTKSLAQLIEDVLDVSRIITGKLQLNRHPVRLIPVLTAAIETVQPAANAKEIQIQSILDSSVAPVMGDEQRLQQIFWNLIANAVKFTPKGGRVEVRLTISDSSYAQITVSDTGIGISSEFLPYVFDRFRQADSTTTRSHGGLGLGLAIVRHLVELHGGTVTVDSPGIGQGATFTLNLPLMPIATPTSLAIANQTPAANALAGVRALIVDDEPDARELLTTILQEYKAQARAVATVPEALEVLQRWQPDIIISDIAMPGEDGYSLIQKIRALTTPDAKIQAIALTAFARKEEQIKALDAGFQTHLAKPVNPHELIAAVAKLTNIQNPSSYLN